MNWVVERNDHDGKGYKPYHPVGAQHPDDVIAFAELDAARTFVLLQINSIAYPFTRTWRIRPYEMDARNAHLQEHYGKLPESEPRRRVVIEVLGGVASVVERPDDVDVIINHLDVDDEVEPF